MTLPAQATIQRWWAPRCTGPFLTIRLHGDGRVTVRPAIGDAVMALDACLRHWNYRTRRADTGAYNCRLKVSGNGWSMHAFATAPDINWSTNPFGPRLVTDMPRAMVEAIVGIRTMSGHQVWQWGGYWRGNKDPMHFEVVCPPWAIATGIDPRTVPGHRNDPLPAPLTPPQRPAPPAPSRPPAAPVPSVPRVPEEGPVFLVIEGRGFFAVVDGIPSQFTDRGGRTAMQRYAEAADKSPGVPRMQLPADVGNPIMERLLRKTAAVIEGPEPRS